MERPRQVRQRAEEVERATLASGAVAASESKGRDRHEELDPFRTAFQVDRDRVLRCQAVDALAGKSTALPARDAPSRLGHAVRTASAARDVARALRLNDDLVEAVAYAGQLGAPPFGEAGVDALSELVGQPFSVSAQSLRVVETLEQGGAGLNLTWEVRDGIEHGGWEQTPAATREGQAVRLVDRIVTCVDAWTRVGRPTLPPAVRSHYHTRPEALIAAMIQEVVERSADRPEVVVSDAAEATLEALADATRRHGERALVTGEHDRAVHVVTSLAIYEVERSRDGDLRVAVDTVCGWSDAAALAAFRDRFLPSA